MQNITGDALLEDKLLKIIKTENEELLKSFLFNTLRGNREHAIGFFHKFIGGHQGKMRFKILELLMLDAGKDLIPLMISAIRLEKNVLFAKSLLFLYGNFEFSEALEALLELDGKMHFDLEKSYQKVAGKLKSRFRELFYIAEFRHGESNSKRMHHASEMMVKEPHPSYPPFLNETLSHRSLLLRKTACRTLYHLGDEDSIAALSQAIPGYFDDRTKAHSLGMFMLNDKTYENPKLGDILSTFAMLGEWEEGQAEKLERQVRAGEVTGTIDMLRLTLLTDDTLITKDIFRFIENFLEGGKPPKTELKRLERLFAEHAESQTGLLLDAFGALGSIGHRLGKESFVAEMENLVPRDTPDGEELLATFLGGYKSESSMERLLSLLTPDQKPELVNKVLSALGHYEFESIPEPLRALANNPEGGLHRQTAMDMVARAGLFPQIMEELMAHKSTIVQVDTIQTMASHKIEEGHEVLMEMLSPDLNSRLQEVVLTALESFPGERTGEVVKPFMMMPNTYMIRYAALKTLMLSGGPSRIQIILSILADYPDKNRPEMVQSFLKMIGADWQAEVLNFLDFWRSLLDDEDLEKMRPAAIELLDKVDWKDVPGEKWLEMLQHIIDSPQVKRTSNENKTIRIIILRIRALVEANQKPKNSGERKALDLESLVERLKGANLHEKMRTFRLLNLHFKPEWYKEDDPSSKQLVRELDAIVTNDMQLPDLMKIAMSLVVRIGHEELIIKLKARLPRLDPELVEFGEKLFSENQPSKSKQAHRPIQRILILDDTILIAKTLQRFLTKSGFHVESLTQPGKALELLGKEHFDLLICDLLMPGMNGFQFISESRRRGTSPRNIIMITSSREREVLQHVAHAKIDGLLLKPFPIQDLLDKIQHLRVA